MSASGFQAAAPGSWSWPEDLPQPRHRSNESEAAGQSASSIPEPAPPTAAPEEQSPPKPENTKPKERHHKPRTCRICLDTVYPSTTIPVEGLFQAAPRVVYESEDGGRLLRPCKCKGTSKYVHEGCLQSWRHADPSYGRRNFYQCPTCQYKYRLQRLGWSTLVTSTAAQIGLTMLILLTVIFILGFIADPIINFALDPYGTLLPGLFFSFGGSFSDFYNVPAPPVNRRRHPRERTGWLEHFTKGFAGLGLMSFLKFMLSSPINFFLRQGGMGGRGGAQNGRDRLNTITWIMIALGVATFLYAVWKAVRNLSRRFLQRAGERVMDVQGDDNDDDDDEEDEGPGP